MIFTLYLSSPAKETYQSNHKNSITLVSLFPHISLQKKWWFGKITEHKNLMHVHRRCKHSMWKDVHNIWDELVMRVDKLSKRLNNRIVKPIAKPKKRSRYFTVQA